MIWALVRVVTSLPLFAVAAGWQNRSGAMIVSTRAPLKDVVVLRPAPGRIGVLVHQPQMPLASVPPRLPHRQQVVIPVKQIAMPFLQTVVKSERIRRMEPALPDNCAVKRKAQVP